MPHGVRSARIRPPTIDAALVAGERLRTIADQWSVSKTALIRHKESHVPDALVKAKDAAEEADADSLLRKVRHLEAEARRIGKKAEQAGDLRTALSGVRELTRIVELLARVQGRLADGVRVGVTMQSGPVEVVAFDYYAAIRAIAPDGGDTPKADELSFLTK